MKKAYRNKAHQFHPDKGGSQADFEVIKEAYDILTTDREKYNRGYKKSKYPKRSAYCFTKHGRLYFDMDEAPELLVEGKYYYEQNAPFIMVLPRKGENDIT